MGLENLYIDESGKIVFKIDDHRENAEFIMALVDLMQENQIYRESVIEAIKILNKALDLSREN